MIEITDNNHALVLNASLKKLHDQARLNGKLESQDLYVLNLLFNLIHECNVTISNKQRKQLECLYITLYNNSKYICKVKTVTGFQVNLDTKFIVRENTDQNIYPVISKVSYWQEPIGVDAQEIVDLIATGTYIDTKPAATKEIFESGVDVTYTDIGLIVFALNCSEETTKYAIYDVLNNDVTNGFQSFYNGDLLTRIFISFNIYSFGTINFKIKQL
jgi:hypothetical protein